MNDLLEIIAKNIKNLLRSKASSLVIILGPLLVIFLAGLAFDNSNPYSVSIGTYIPEKTTDTETLLTHLDERFSVENYDTEEACKEAISTATINSCLVFDRNFAIGQPNSNKITYYVDYSKINLVWTIAQTMSQEVGETSLNASKDYTKALLETIEFTKEKVAEERKLVLQLATENELINRNAQDIETELGDINLQLNENDFPIDNVTHANTQVKQWVDNALALGDKGLSKSISFIDAADSIVKQSGVSTESKANLLAAFQTAVDDIKKVQGDFAQTKNLTQDSYKRFQAELSTLSEKLTDLKAQLNDADTSRQLGIRVLQAVQNLLDQSLVTISDVQGILNDIDDKIGSLEITDAEGITQPIRTSIKPLVQEKTYLNYLFPVLIVLIIMFTALLIAPTLIMLEKHSPASFRTAMTPIPPHIHVIATFLTSWILLLFQIIIVLAITSIFFTDTVTNTPQALVLLLLVTPLFILIGMTLGYAFTSEETATLGGVSVGAGLLFLSDVIIPLESMPQMIAALAKLNPYVLSSQLLRQSLLYDSGILAAAPKFLIIMGYTIAAALITIGTYLVTNHYSIMETLRKVTPIITKPFHKKR